MNLPYSISKKSLVVIFFGFSRPVFLTCICESPFDPGPFLPHIAAAFSIVYLTEDGLFCCQGSFPWTAYLFCPLTLSFGNDTILAQFNTWRRTPGVHNAITRFYEKAHLHFYADVLLFFSFLSYLSVFLLPSGLTPSAIRMAFLSSISIPSQQVIMNL